MQIELPVFWPGQGRIEGKNFPKRTKDRTQHLPWIPMERAVLDEEASAHLSVVGTEPRQRSNERRDIQRTIDLWQRNILDGDTAPSLTNFDFSPLKGDWGHRFLICSDQTVDAAAFILYGAKFAELLNLPEKVTAIVPLLQQVPERYRPVFAQGCTRAMREPRPARFSGSFSYDFKAELYRAVFLPIRLHPSWSKRFIFGSLNYRTVLSIDRKGE